MTDYLAIKFDSDNELNSDYYIIQKESSLNTIDLGNTVNTF